MTDGDGCCIHTEDPNTAPTNSESRSLDCYCNTRARAALLLLLVSTRRQRRRWVGRQQAGTAQLCTYVRGRCYCLFAVGRTLLHRAAALSNQPVITAVVSYGVVIFPADQERTTRVRVGRIPAAAVVICLLLCVCVCV